jgi:hypothetical protein
MVTFNIPTDISIENTFNTERDPNTSSPVSHNLKPMDATDTSDFIPISEIPELCEMDGRDEESMDAISDAIAEPVKAAKAVKAVPKAFKAVKAVKAVPKAFKAVPEATIKPAINYSNDENNSSDFVVRKSFKAEIDYCIRNCTKIITKYNTCVHHLMKCRDILSSISMYRHYVIIFDNVHSCRNQYQLKKNNSIIKNTFMCTLSKLYKEQYSNKEQEQFELQEHVENIKILNKVLIFYLKDVFVKNYTILTMYEFF